MMITSRFEFRETSKSEFDLENIKYFEVDQD